MLTKDKKICVSISILLLKLTRKILKHHFLEEMGGEGGGGGGGGVGSFGA